MIGKSLMFREPNNLELKEVRIYIFKLSSST